MNTHAAQALAAAIYQEVCIDLINSYRENNVIRQQELENWIRKDPYGILKVPDRTIAGCRYKAKKRGRIRRAIFR